MTYTTTLIQKNKKNNITPSFFTITSTLASSFSTQPVLITHQSSHYSVAVLPHKRYAPLIKRKTPRKTRTRSKAAQIAKARRARFDGKELEKRAVQSETLHMIEQSQRELVNKLA